MEQIKTLIITQARLGSTRLPGKVLLKVNEEELLKIHLKRLSKSRLTNKIIVATTINQEDEQIAILGKECGFEVVRGSVDNVLDRFYQAALPVNPQWVVRVTSDCPLIDPLMIDAVIACAQVNDVDYCANILVENFPDGQDVEVFKFSALQKTWNEARLKSELEHVTPYIRNNSDSKGGTLFTSINFPSAANYSDIRMTVDELADFELMKKVITDLGTEATWLQYSAHIIQNNLQAINGKIIRNEGFLKSLKND